MVDMVVTVTHAVHNALQKQVLIQEAINNKIVSYNKLAKYLKPKIEAELDKPVNNSAVIMAIRRNSEKIKSCQTEDIPSPSIETIRTDIFEVVVEESPTIISKVDKLRSLIGFKKGGLLNIVNGNYEVAIITNLRYKEDLLDLLIDEKILCENEDLVSISFAYSKDHLLTRSVLYELSRYLAWDNINVVDMLLTKTELNLIIKKEDLTRFYNDPPWKATDSEEKEVT